MILFLPFSNGAHVENFPRDNMSAWQNADHVLGRCADDGNAICELRAHCLLPRESCVNVLLSTVQHGHGLGRGGPLIHVSHTL